MIPSRNQHTIAASCRISGRGYWSGKEVGVAMHPAPVDAGVCFVRTDIAAEPRCQAHVDARSDARLRTNIQQGNAQFQMIEHLMAALYALEIDNCIVEVDGEELPGLDGSAAAYVDALRHAGLIVQAGTRRTLVIQQTLRVGNGSGWIEASPSRGGKACFEYQLSFDGASPIGNQSYRVELNPRRFVRELASARTFVTAAQAKEIRAAGLASHVSNQDLLVIGDGGPIDNQYRFTNECARHKTLDLIGDLALAGIDLVGNFVSFRGGHQLNGLLASQLAQLATTQTTSLGQPAPPRRKAA